MRGPITQPRLLLCEGPDDVSFFQKLIAERNLPQYAIRDTSERRGAPAGNGRFETALRALRVGSEANFAIVKRLLIVADNDDDPAGRFQLVRGQIERVFGQGSAPASPLVRKIAGHELEVMVLMIPWQDEPGHLETACQPAARNANATTAAFTDEFAQRCGVNQWPSLTRRNDMWMRSNISVRCRDKPWADLGLVFREFPELINVRHNSLNRIADTVRDFGAI